MHQAVRPEMYSVIATHLSRLLAYRIPLMLFSFWRRICQEFGLIAAQSGRIPGDSGLPLPAHICYIHPAVHTHLLPVSFLLPYHTLSLSSVSLHLPVISPPWCPRCKVSLLGYILTFDPSVLHLTRGPARALSCADLSRGPSHVMLIWSPLERGPGKYWRRLSSKSSWLPSVCSVVCVCVCVCVCSFVWPMHVHAFSSLSRKCRYSCCHFFPGPASPLSPEKWVHANMM